MKAIIVLLIVFALAWYGFERYNDSQGRTYTRPIEYSKCTTADGQVIYGQPLPGVECVKNERIESTITVVPASKSSGMNSKPDSKSSVSKGKYRCDGRTYCSEMTSCEEAEFFLKNCPNAEMDGDYDGVPCEHQWCS